MRSRWIALVGIIVGVAAYSFPAAVAANAPVTEGPFTEEGVVEIIDCGAFVINDQYVLTWTETFYFDSSGTPVKLIEQVWGSDTFINASTGEQSTGKFHNTVVVDLAIGVGQNTGIVFRISVPGAGAVFLDIGRIVGTQEDHNAYFQAGPHQFEDGDFSELCAALA
jgi:hypothetical protein